MNFSEMKEFYSGRKVLVTGHTGFKGSWMCQVLETLGADVAGYSLNPPTEPSMYRILNTDNIVESHIGDIANLDDLMKVFKDFCPEIVIHMAAQPIVRESYKNPVGTYAANVMGTVNLLECVRKTDSVKTVINVTTDKVYLNRELNDAFTEDEELNGYDPYSNSKSCSELVTSSYKNSFFTIPASGDMSGVPACDDNGMRYCAISTCRAGNVIGGGDFAVDRIIPDCIRAVENKKEIIVRNPLSTRPYQHVLEPVCIYLYLAMQQYKNPLLASSYNIGPDENDCINTGRLADVFCEKWFKQTGTEICWKDLSDGGPHEAKFLRLDCTKLKETLNWKPRWVFDDAMNALVEWYAKWIAGEDMIVVTRNQILQFFEV